MAFLELASAMLPIAFSLTETFNDFNLVLKIFVLLAVISFVRTHLGQSAASLVVIIGMFFFIFGDYWKIFGGIYVLYMLFTFGISSIIIDFFFVTGGGGGGKAEAPVSSGVDIMSRMSGGAMMHRPRPPMGR